MTPLIALGAAVVLHLLVVLAVAGNASRRIRDAHVDGLAQGMRHERAWWARLAADEDWRVQRRHLPVPLTREERRAIRRARR